jgi:hypothetical protein
MSVFDPLRTLGADAKLLTMWTGSTAEALFAAWCLLGGCGLLIYAGRKRQLPSWFGPVTADTGLFWLGIAGLAGAVCLGIFVVLLRLG